MSTNEDDLGRSSHDWPQPKKIHHRQPCQNRLKKAYTSLREEFCPPKIGSKKGHKLTQCISVSLQKQLCVTPYLAFIDLHKKTLIDNFIGAES